MKKKKIIRIVLTVIMIGLGLTVLGLYVGDLIINNTPPTQNLARTLILFIGSIFSVVRLWMKNGRRTLSFFNAHYADQLRGAFSYDPKLRKKLLRALRIYNEDNFGKALDRLLELKPLCRTQDDLHAVGLFTGVVLTDMGHTQEAIAVYQTLIQQNAACPTVFGNLGLLYSQLGHTEDAISTMKMAIDFDPKNAASYNNLANFYFDIYDFENAKAYALKALEVNYKTYQAAALLAIIYALEEDKENKDKYFHMALAGGQNPAALKNAILRYKQEKAAMDLDDDG